MSEGRGGRDAHLHGRRIGAGATHAAERLLHPSLHLLRMRPAHHCGRTGAMRSVAAEETRASEADVPEVHTRGVFTAAASPAAIDHSASCRSRGGPVALCTATSHASRTTRAMTSVKCMCRRVERTRGASAVTDGGLQEGSGSSARARTWRQCESAERQEAWRGYSGCVHPRTTADQHPPAPRCAAAELTTCGWRPQAAHAQRTNAGAVKGSCRPRRGSQPRPPPGLTSAGTRTCCSQRNPRRVGARTGLEHGAQQHQRTRA